MQELLVLWEHALNSCGCCCAQDVSFALQESQGEWFVCLCLLTMNQLQAIQLHGLTMAHPQHIADWYGSMHWKVNIADRRWYTSSQSPNVTSHYFWWMQSSMHLVSSSHCLMSLLWESQIPVWLHITLGGCRAPCTWGSPPHIAYSCLQNYWQHIDYVIIFFICAAENVAQIIAHSILDQFEWFKLG